MYDFTEGRRLISMKKVLTLGKIKGSKSQSNNKCTENELKLLNGVNKISYNK
jgi:hypothetical protein